MSTERIAVPELPVVVKYGLFDMQVCVPADWTDDQVVLFSELTNPCGTTNGWQIRKAGDELLGGDPERQPCNDRAGCVHIMLDA